jgi:hypothetical protein
MMTVELPKEERKEKAKKEKEGRERVSHYISSRRRDSV